MKKITLDKNKIIELDCSFLLKFYNDIGHIKNSQSISYPQEEHYKLLTYLTRQFDNEIIIDAGTHQGLSAMCLASNPTNRVHSYDLYTVNRDDFFGFNASNIQHTFIGKNYPNIEFHNQDILKISDDLIKETHFIFLDVGHDGETERAFTQKLIKANFEGIMVCDDIHLNQNMINWFSSIQLKKQDITTLGHRASGTGIISFGHYDFYVIL